MFASTLVEMINLTGSLRWHQFHKSLLMFLQLRNTSVDALFAKLHRSLLQCTANPQKMQYVLMDGPVFGLVTVLSCKRLLDAVVVDSLSPAPAPA
jgi:hypothetical protein